MVDITDTLRLGDILALPSNQSKDLVNFMNFLQRHNNWHKL
jgi:hypothetical protein